MTVNIKFTSPDLISIGLKDNKLYLILDWGDEIGTSIISKNINGFNYEDVEYEFTRFFSSPEFMINECNLPINIDILQLLPITNEANKKFQPSARMIEDINALISKLKASKQI